MTDWKDTEMHSELYAAISSQFGEIVAELMEKGVSPEGLVNILPAEDHK